MEGDSREDLVTAALAAITLAADNVSHTDLVARIAQLQAQNGTLVAKNKELVLEKDKLMSDLVMLKEDNSSMEDRIAELESDVKNLDDSTEASFCDNDDEDPTVPPSPNDPLDKIPKDKIPKWRIRYICDRIATGQRPTICNMMYINIYANINRFHGAEKFRQRIVSAFWTLCVRYKEELGIPSIDPNDIPTDFDAIKNHLKDMATVSEQEYIINMSRVFQNA
jgi:cell division protein FtsB